jgi:hypothetical protein
MRPSKLTPAGNDPPATFEALSPRERARLLVLAQRYRMRRDITLRLGGRRGVRLARGAWSPAPHGPGLGAACQEGLPVIVATDAGLYPVGSLNAEIEHLAHVASAVLNTHTNDHGRCATCVGVAFPCDRALLAEHNLAVL